MIQYRRKRRIDSNLAARAHPGFTEHIVITEADIRSFLAQHNYDIRVTGNGRWLDQKVTFDVSSMIADCVRAFVADKGNVEFTASDIWYSPYAASNILAIFNKPKVDEESAKNEYDKFFSQPLLFLASAQVLNLRKQGNQNYYSVNNEELLDYIAAREYNAFIFTSLYIEKVMKDSGLWPYFETFFKQQDKPSYEALKDSFANFLREYTPINGVFEPNRIFTKVLNPLAVARKKLGTRRGYLSKSIISLSDLQYNQTNFRDLHSRKPKEVSRQEWAIQSQNSLNSKRTQYQVDKAKGYLRKFNSTYRSDLTELSDQWGHGQATQIHHIFPVSDYPEISDVIENLIALTPTQHMTKAHPRNHTHLVDLGYQRELLLAKIESVRANLSGLVGVPIYSFEQLVDVISIGFDIEIDVDYGDYKSLTRIIESYYSDKLPTI